jgi:hypothetical protein
MKTILSLSGGLDSTYLLWKLLSETSDEITAVFIDVSNADHRIRQKYDIRGFTFEESGGEFGDKVQAIVDWLKTNVRDFTFIVEPVDVNYLTRGISSPNNPPAYLTRYAVPKINDGTYDRLCLSNEWGNDGFSNGGTTTVRRVGAWVAHDIFAEQATRGRLDFTLLDMDYNQAYAISEMPPSLYDLFKPDGGRKSTKREWFKSQLDSGMSPKEVGDFAKSKCMLPDGKWHSINFWVVGISAEQSQTWDMPTWPSSYEVPFSG